MGVHACMTRDERHFDTGKVGVVYGQGINQPIRESGKGTWRLGETMIQRGDHINVALLSKTQEMPIHPEKQSL